MTTLPNFTWATAALLLSACAAPTVQQPHGRVDVLLSTDRGMRSIAFDARHTYLSLANSAARPSAVLQSGKIINRASVWSDIELGACRLGPVASGQAARAPALQRVAGNIWLYQGTGTDPAEHAVCKLERAYEWFIPRDEGLRACAPQGCEPLSPTGLHHGAGQVLAGAGLRVAGTADQGASWRTLVAATACSQGAFHLAGPRLLVAGCGPQGPMLRAWQWDGRSAAASLPLALPDLEQRQIHVIAPGGRADTLFVGMDGALLRSQDGGSSFQYVLFHGREGRNFPHILSILALRKQARVVLAAGFDQGTGKPYLAVSRDGGAIWTDLSAILPGHAARDGHGRLVVTSMAQDRAGRVLLTLHQMQGGQGPQGHLLLLTLGGVD